MLLMSCLAMGLGAQANKPTVITIVSDDYAFVKTPTALPPGETVFAFVNQGTQRHELNLRLLKPGVTVEQAMRAAIQGGGGAGQRSLVERSIGVLIAQAHDTSGGRLLVTLLPGRVYAMVCIFRDTPDAQEHVMLGMLGGFTVKEH